jgi:hypothetical protein
MARMRAVLIVLMVLPALALGACGGDDTSQDRSSSRQSGQSTTAGPDGSAAGGNATGKSGKRSKSGSGKSRAGSRAGAKSKPHFRGVDQSNYEISKTICGRLTAADAALRYRAKSKRPADIARAYAQISYQVPRLQRAAAAGCLDGLQK